MSNKNKIKEKIGIQESLSVEVEKNPVIYRRKFLEEYKKCEKNNFAENNIIFCFIFLQIYFECFFHFRLRKLVELEFKLSNPDIWEKWIDCNNKKCIERRYVQDKKGRKGKLSEFIKYFNFENNKEIKKLKKEIEKELQDITNIRDLLVHGHKIAEGNNFNNQEYKTKVKKYLTEESLKEAIEKVNKGATAWNNFFDKLLPLLKTNYETVKNFKFEKIELSDLDK